MKRSTEQKIEQALESLADGLQEIGGMGLLELRFKFKSILARVEKKVREAHEELHRDLGGQ
jgi:hypothetical protein